MAVSKKTDEEVKRSVARLKQEIEALKQAAQEHGKSFSSLSEEELAKKVRGETSKSPFIYAQSWNSAAAAGSNVNYTVYVHNPDPGGYFPVFVSIFFGLGNFFDVGPAWDGRDKRWPEFSSDRTNFGANSDKSFSFNYVVPSGLPLGTYNGNSVVWRGEWHDVGTMFDRGSFDLKIL